MKKPATLLLACLGMTVLAGSPSVGQGVKPVPLPFFYGCALPRYPGLTHLCHQRIYSKETRQNLVWDGFSSPVSTARVVRFYKRTLGVVGFTPNKTGGAWALQIKDGYPKVILTILPVETGRPYRVGGKKPPTNTRTIVALSRDEF